MPNRPRCVATARVALSFLAACSFPTFAAVQADAPPTWIDAASATYRGIGDLPQVTLANGRWEGAPAAPGAASRPVVTLVRDAMAVGDLDADGAADAVVLLSLATGGSGDTSYLAVLSRRAGIVSHVATATLGDRVQLRSLAISGTQAVVEVV